ncbi:MAG: globin [Bryobacteraceae bacterium]
MEELEIYNAIGEDGFHRLIAAFYAQVPADDVLGPMYPAEDMVGAEERLRDYLIYRFGGPQKYIEERGHPRLRGRHMPFPIDKLARDRWMQLMDNAFEQVKLPADAAAGIRTFFDQMATFMINRMHGSEQQ